MIIIKGDEVMNNNEPNNDSNNELSALSLGTTDNSMETLNEPINEIPSAVGSIPEPIESTNLNKAPESINDVSLNINSLPNNEEIKSNEVTTDINTLQNPSEVKPEDNNLSDSTNVSPNTQSIEQQSAVPVAPVNYDIPEVIDNTPVYNEIGVVPPITNAPILNQAVAESVSDDVPHKKPMSKPLFVIVILLALIAVGGGVYAFLSLASNRVEVLTKTVLIEQGSSVPTDINVYATFKNIDSSTCNFDTTDITNTDTLGSEYKFRISCADKTYIGKAKIVDTKAPNVTLKEVLVGIDGEVAVEDFIDDCQDTSKCSYRFKDEEKLKEYLSSASSYHVPIIVSDEAGNEVEVTGTLKVSEDSGSSTVSLICTIENDGITEVNKFGLSKGEFNKKTNRSYTFTLSSSDYNKLKEENKDKTEMTYKDITGKPTFDDATNTLTLTKNISYDDLTKEVGSSVPTSFAELKSLFENKDYTCSIG